MPAPRHQKIVIPGGAGLVGQNLVVTLQRAGYRRLVVLDKHHANLAVLRERHPDIVAEVADLAEPGAWTEHFRDAATVVMLQAQIGDPNPAPFVRNNVTATGRVLDAMKRFSVPYLVHVSSSVVKSVADDHYVRTKAEQERLVLASGIACVVLRPTLMFGWFDRKHLGWLSRFMKRMPVFPVPGDGRYLRQPLFVEDFCGIIRSCIEQRIAGETFDITGLENVDYIDIIREIRRATGARARIIHLPYRLFRALLQTWALFDGNPPFTADQLKALVAHDEFQVIDWPNRFGVRATPFTEAIDRTFNDPEYSRVALAF